MHKLLSIQNKEDIPEEFRETPIGELLLYHNVNIPHKSYTKATLLVGMCMDNRKSLNVPQNFAYTIRTGGANLTDREFYISYAVGVGGIKHMALIGHTQCGMVNLPAKKEQFVKGLSEHAGWDEQSAEKHFIKESSRFEINNEINFVLSETTRLSKLYPKIKIAPLLYKVEDHRLYWIDADT